MTGLDYAHVSRRTYDREIMPHAHDHLQLVFPIAGKLEIEIGGRGALLFGRRAAVVSPQTRHAQWASGANRFIVIDCGGDLSDLTADRFEHKPFIEISPAVVGLLDFLRLAGPQLPAERGVAASALILGCLLEPDREDPRLSRVRRSIDAALDQRWTVASMARGAGISVSRLHALFRAHGRQTPQQYLSKARLRCALEMLEETDIALADVAAAVGYSDQSALTRAMQRQLGVTPGGYRRKTRQ